ncbi:hypothetical protein D3C75_646140 [compost metagenome]
MVGAVVDAANEGPLAIDHHDLAVQAPEQVGTHAHQARLRVEGVETDPGIGHGRNERLRQVGRAVAIHGHFDTHAAVGGIDQYLLQLLANLVIEDDEGLQQDFLPCLGHGLEHAGVVLLAIDQQLHAVAVYPGSVHSLISEARGAWSERCDHGYFDSTWAVPGMALRR